MPKRRLQVVSRLAGLVCLVGASSCRSQDQTSEELEGPSDPDELFAPPPAFAYQSAARDALLRTPRDPLGSTPGDDVRISPILTRSLSENSIAVHPLDRNVLLCAHNSITYPSASNRAIHIDWSLDGGSSWTGTEVDSGFADPAAAIDRDGNFYVGYINDGISQMLHFSGNRGTSWGLRRVATRDESLRGDKNHLVVDTGSASPFAGRLYAAWTALRGAPFAHVVFTASGDKGTSWTPIRDVSAGVGGISHMGVNLQTGPAGELYCCWAIYDAGTQYEVALGFNASFDGGNTFLGPTRALTNLRGTSRAGVPNTGIRTNSFPAMAVDRSGGPRNGWIYLFWTNIGVPGVNAGDADVYVARSRDSGLVWDAPVRVNDDATTNAQWQVWGTCDQVNGDLYAVFLDRREDPTDSQARTWVARSTDGGESWVQQPVGDQPFTPRPIPNSGSYMGDYLGIAALAGRVVPLWSDWRENPLTAYTSPLAFDIAAPFVSCPEPFTVEGTTSGGASASDPAIAAFLARASAQDETDPEPALATDAPPFFPLGTTLVTFSATDDAGHASRCTAPLTVLDTTPPDFDVTPSQAVLAPADHRLVPIDVSASVADVVDPDASFVLVSIGSSEADSGRGPGDLAKDIQDVQLGTPDTRFLLRAENFSRGAGRIYTIKYAARDASGNTRTRSLSVSVKP